MVKLFYLIEQQGKPLVSYLWLSLVENKRKINLCLDILDDFAITIYANKWI